MNTSLEEMNQRAFEVCERYAAMQDFVHDERREDFETGDWTATGRRLAPAVITFSDQDASRAIVKNLTVSNVPEAYTRQHENRV